MKGRILISSLLILISSNSLAEESLPINTQGISIIGDQELPQVLYIVPWKESEFAKPNQPQINHPVLRPLEPCNLEKEAYKDYSLWSCPE